MIGPPTAVVALQTQHLLTRSPDGQITPVGEMQWSDALPVLLQQKVMQSFEDAGLVATLTPPTDYAKNDRQLQLDLRRFDVTEGADRLAVVAFSAKILSGDGHVMRTKVFEAKSTVAGDGDPAAVKALSTAFGNAVADLGRWLAQPTASALPEPADPPGSPETKGVPL